jgi:cobalt-zinc-cadmium resistance protein CzcA
MLFQDDTHQLTARPHAGLREELLKCGFDRALGDSDSIRNFFIRKTLEYAGENLLFPLGEWLRSIFLRSRDLSSESGLELLLVQPHFASHHVTDSLCKQRGRVTFQENPLGVFHVLGQPNLNVTVNRDAAARYQINVADVQDAIQTAVGGTALTQVLKGEARYDLVLRYLPKYRDTKEAIENIRLLSPSGERVSLAQLCKIVVADGGSEIYREGNQRYVAIKYSVRGRDLGGAVEEAMRKVNEQVKLLPGYHIDWEGEYESQKRADERLLIVLPITILIIFVILYTMFKSFKWALLILANVAMARIGGLLALLITGTNFSVSSGVGFLALFGVSVQTGVIMLE